jgi:hypothetical protein
MRKLFFAVMFAFILLSSITYAAEQKSLYMVAGIGGGYYYPYPKDTQVQNFYKGGMMWKGFLEFKSNNGLSLLGDVGYYSEGNRDQSYPYGTNLSIVPITASISYHLFKDAAISPYFGGGFGLYMISENDPDFNYFNTTKFGKHLFAGIDMYLSADTLLRAEIRDSFIDPVSNTFYYLANFGGLTATLSLGVEWPIFGPEKELTPEERALARQERLYDAELQAYQNKLNEMQFYYQQKEWDQNAYHRYKNREYLQQNINKTQDQANEAQKKLDDIKAEQAKKRQLYIDEKLKLRQEKKDSLQNK